MQPHEDVPLRQIELRRSLHRPNLIGGAERELVLILGIMTFASIFSAVSVVSAIVGIFVWLAVYSLLRIMGRADPEMSKVYRRSQKYKAYYRPYSTPFRKE